MPAAVHAADTVLPVVAPPIAGGAVGLEDGRVVAVGPLEEVMAALPGVRVRRWRGVLTPGLVNAHTHLQYTAMADLAAQRMPFPDWLVALVRRARAMTDAAWAESARTGAFLALRSGTTSLADVVTHPVVLAPVARSGLGGVSYVETVALDDAGWSGGGCARLAAALDTAPPGRAVGVSPHTLYTLSRAAFRGTLEAGRARRLRVHTHLAETVEETRYVALGDGPFARSAERMHWDMDLVREHGAGHSPASELDGLGGLGRDVHVAHGVHCDADDRALLRERGTAVALCPRSNRTLRAGDPPVAAYLAEGSPVAVGTDSLASSPSLDLLEEVRAVRDLARRQGYDAADLEQRLLAAATIGGAQAMGLADAGYLAPCARADLAVFDVPGGRDPYRALVDQGPGECALTVLAGRMVHRRG